MYYRYFGLSEAPFSIAVNPRYLYMSPRHRDALAHLLYGVGSGGGFILLTGEVGTGKTTLNRCFLEHMPESADVAIVLNPALDAQDLLASVCEELGIDVAGEAPGLKALTDSLQRYLLRNHARGRKTVLIIDEAQHLGFEVLEQIRLLTNLETNEEKLLHIILIGQPELAEKLARPELRQLDQRITARFDLSPLSAAETTAYIRHRLHIAGLPAGRELFSPALLAAVHRQSRGIPRLINLLCDRMLLGAYGNNQPTLDRRLLRRAAREALGEGRVRRTRWIPALALAAAVLVPAALWRVLAPKSGPGRGPATGESRAEAIEIPAPETPALAPPTAAERWRLSPAEGAVRLAALYGLEVPAGARSPCAAARPAELSCEAIEVRSWERLQAEDRPALLGLVDERRFESRALFLGLEGEQAVLAGADGVLRRPLAQLAPLWTGEVWRLWRRPAGVRRTLSRGERGEDVRAVASLFARLDGQADPLTGDVFNERLETRVRLFQRARNLSADGVLGQRTLRALTLAAGEDLSMAAARERLSAAGEP